MGTHSELQSNYPNGTYVSFCKKQQTAEAEQQQEVIEFDEDAIEAEMAANPIDEITKKKTSSFRKS